MGRFLRRRGATAVETGLMIAMVVLVIGALTAVGLNLEAIFSRTGRALTQEPEPLPPGFSLALGAWQGGDELSLPVTVRLGAALPEGTSGSVRLQTQPLDAEPGTDFIPLDIELSFSGTAGEQQQAMLSARRGLVFGQERRVTLRLAAPVGAQIGAGGSATVAIPGPQVPPAVSFAEAGPIALEEGAATATAVQVVLDRPMAQDVDIALALTYGTAEEADLALEPAIVTVPALETTATALIAAPADADKEAEETAVLALTAPAPLSAGAVTSRPVSVAANGNPPVLSLPTVPQTLAEGGAPVLLALTLSGRTVDPVQAQVQVLDEQGAPSADLALSVDGTAVTDGMVAIPPGALDAVLSVEAIADGVYEGEEALVLSLAGATGAVPGEDVAVPLTVTETDAVPTLTLAGPTALAEGGSIELTLTASAPSAAPIRIPYTLAGSGDSPADPASDLTAPAASGEIVLAAQALETVLLLQAADEGSYEGDETLVLTLGTPSIGTVTPTQLALTITEASDEPQLSFASDAATALAEGAEGERWRLVLDRPTTRAVIVNWAVDDAAGDGTAGPEDFASASGSVTVAAGATEAFLPLQAVADGIYEGTEAATLRLSSPQNASLGAAELTLQIGDGDAVPTVAFDADTPNANAPEGGAEARFALVLNRAASRALTAQLQVGGTAMRAGAAEDADYALTAEGGDIAIDAQGLATVTYPAGTIRVTLVVTAAADELDEPTETAVLTLSDPQPGGLGLSAVQATRGRTASILDANTDPFAFASAATGSYGQAFTSAAVTLTGMGSAQPITAEWEEIDGAGPAVTFTVNGAEADEIASGQQLRVVTTYPEAFKGRGVLRVSVGGAVADLTLATAQARSCLQHRQLANASSDGAYTIDPDGNGDMEVGCDMQTAGGGWTVFQRRSDGGGNFQGSWAAYKAGFGSATGTFWLGNDRLARLTGSGSWRLRADVAYGGESAFEEYPNFRIAGESDRYRATVTGTPAGNAGFSMQSINGFTFSTVDSDNSYSCSAVFSGGWWYNSCHNANPNGTWGNETNYARGLSWRTWRGYYRSMSRTELKVREASAGGSNLTPSANAPVHPVIPELTAYVGIPFSFQVPASDADGDSVSFFDETIPEQLLSVSRISRTGVLSFTPTQAMAASAYTFTMVDGTGRWSQGGVSIRVLPQPRDCDALYDSGQRTDGTYTVYPAQDGNGVQVYCLMGYGGTDAGWTVVASSFANPAGNTSQPFDLTYDTAVGSGRGTPGIGGNYFMPLNAYAQIAAANRPVRYRWYAQRANAASEYQMTQDVTAHYLERTGNRASDFIFRGADTRAQSRLVYFNQALSAKDGGQSPGCAVSWGSFGWFTGCHDSHFWSMTPDNSGNAALNGFSNYAPDALGSYDPWYHLIIIIAPL